jgi:cyclophilin family peptidyl-prolyl cis-trans isomerase/HEAT repeat protein
MSITAARRAVCYDCDLQIELVKKHEAKITIICMTLLAFAAGYVLLTRPFHRIEGDFLEREDRPVVDEWLLSQLQVTVAEQRARACLALGRIGDPATLTPLLNALKDDAASVRAAAAFAVGVMEDTEALADLGRQPRREAAEALLPLLEDDERAVASAAVEALGKLGFADLAERLTQTAAPYPISLTALVRLHAIELAPWIAERLKSDDQDNRWAAALALNALDVPSDAGITRSFLNLTKDRDAAVRAEVVAGLGRSESSQEVFEALVRMTSDPDPKVRIEAAGALAKLHHPGTLEVLAKMLGDRNENVAAASVRAIGKLGDRQAARVLEPLRFRASIVSYRAEEALAGLAGSDGAWIEGVRPLPGNYRTQEGIRAVAAVLGRSGSTEALDLLREMWKDSAPEIRAERVAVLRALRERSAPELDEYLSEALRSADPALRVAALELTSEPEIGLCRDVFENAAQQEMTALQLAALDAAARSAAASGDVAQQAHSLFLKALEAQDRLVRIRAVKHLRSLHSEDHGEKIGPAQTRYEQQDYQRIARTVGHRVRMETSAGTMEIALDYRNAALTAENFVELAGKGFFDGQRFVEVVPGRYLKAGVPPGDAVGQGSGLPKPDPATSASLSGGLLGGPGHAIRSEINSQPFLRGSLGMSVGTRDSAGSQFFICLSQQPLADGRYTNFGRLLSGDDLLDQITVETRILRMTVVE